MTTSPLGEIRMAALTIYVRDLDAAVAWYEEKLGLVPLAHGNAEHPFATFHLGGALVVLEPITEALEASPMGSDNATMNLLVERDPHDLRAELVERGVQCGRVVSSSSFASFLVRDLDGNRFYVAKPLKDAAGRDPRAST
ncbi:MAG: VOC family protein [Acidimicrobiales bacterium]